jgi:hypothetical protein
LDYGLEWQLQTISLLHDLNQQGLKQDLATRLLLPHHQFGHDWHQGLEKHLKIHWHLPLHHLHQYLEPQLAQLPPLFLLRHLHQGLEQQLTMPLPHQHLDYGLEWRLPPFSLLRDLNQGLKQDLATQLPHQLQLVLPILDLQQQLLPPSASSLRP